MGDEDRPELDRPPTHQRLLSQDTGDALNGFMAQRYPNFPGGTQTAIASVLSVRHTTTLNSSMINEFTGGFQRPRLRLNSPWKRNGIDKVLPSTF